MTTNNTPQYTPQDLTTYALGELDPASDAHRTITAALDDDPALRAEIDAIKTSAAAVREALTHEPVPASTSRDREGAGLVSVADRAGAPLPDGRGSLIPMTGRPHAPLFARPALLAAGFALAAGAAVTAINLIQPDPQTPANTAHLTPAADTPRGLDAIHAALQTPITASFQDAPLSAVFDTVAQQTHADLAVDWPALEARGIARDTAFNFDADALPARDLLSLALAACWQQLPHPDPAVWTVTTTQVRVEPRSAVVQRAFDQAQVVLAANNTTRAHMTPSQLALADHPAWQQPGAVTEVMVEQRRAAAQRLIDQELARQAAEQAQAEARAEAEQNNLVAEARLQLAQDKADEAMEALANQQPALAAQLLEEALLLDPVGPRSQQLTAMLAEARAQANFELRPADPLTNRAQDIEIARQETAARYEQAMTRAVEALNNKEFDAGHDAIIEARTVLNANRSSFSEQERNDLVARAAALQTSISNTRAMDEAQRIAQAEMDLRDAQRESRATAEQRRTEQVQQRLQNAQRLHAQGRTAEARIEMEAAQFIDPTLGLGLPNTAPALGGQDFNRNLGQSLGDLTAANDRLTATLSSQVPPTGTRDLRWQMQAGTQTVEAEQQLRRQLDLMRSNHQIINDEATVPAELGEAAVHYDELLTYPGNWPELTQMRLARLQGQTDSAEKTQAHLNTRTTALLRRPSSITFHQQSLNDVIDYVRDVTGASIAVHWPALQAAGVARDQKITLTADHLPGEEILRQVLAQVNQGLPADQQIGYEISDGVAQIATPQALPPDPGTPLLPHVLAEVQREQLMQDIQRANLGLERELNRDTYALVNDNPFYTGFNDPLSTFSVDVDTAAYALVRRQVMQQNQPPVPGAVRIEELVNYFDYGYAAPRIEPGLLDNGLVTQASLDRLAEGDDTFAPFATHVEVADCPWADGHRLVRVGIKGMEVAQEDRPAAHLTFLLDVSGSMRADNKLPLVVESMKMLLSQLNPDDHVSIVVYAGAAGVVLEHAAASDPAAIEAALNKLRAGGSTAGGEGIQLAYDLAQRHFVDGGINRVVLCTDGDFNVGLSDRDALVELIKDRANPDADPGSDNGTTRGVYLSVLGFGMGNLNDNMMEPLTNAGNGNYAYIDSAEEAHKIMVEQVGGTLVAIAKDVKIQVEFNPARVLAYRLIGYENRILAAEDFADDTVDAGDIGAGHTVTALYEIIPFPGDGLGDDERVLEVKRQIEALDAALAFNASVLENTPLTEEQYRKLMGSVAMMRQQRSVAVAMQETVKRRPASAVVDEGPAGIDLRYRRGVEVVEDVDELMVVNLRYKPVDAPAEQGTSRLIQTVVAPEALPFDEVSEDTRFAAAVAGYGMVLRNSPHRGDASFRWVLDTASGALGEDAHGYRAGFVALVERSAQLRPADAKKERNVIAPR